MNQDSFVKRRKAECRSTLVGSHLACQSVVTNSESDRNAFQPHGGSSKGAVVFSLFAGGGEDVSSLLFGRYIGGRNFRPARKRTLEAFLRNSSEKPAVDSDDEPHNYSVSRTDSHAIQDEERLKGEYGT